MAEAESKKPKTSGGSAPGEGGLAPTVTSQPHDVGGSQPRDVGGSAPTVEKCENHESSSSGDESSSVSVPVSPQKSPRSPVLSPDKSGKLRDLALHIDNNVLAEFAKDGSMNNPASSHAAGSSASEPPAASSVAPNVAAAPISQTKTQPKSLQAQPKASLQAQPKTVVALCDNPATPEEVERECQYCRRTVGPNLYSTVFPSGKCRCRDCSSGLARDRHTRGEVEENDRDYIKQMPMADRMAWHRDHASVSLRDLPHAMTDFIMERRSCEVLTSNYAGGPLLDDADLKAKYKDKLDQYENIKKFAYTCTHPTRKVQVWEDVELKRNWQFIEKRQTDCTREASGAIIVKAKRQAKPPKAKTEGEQQAKPLGAGLKNSWKK